MKNLSEMTDEPFFFDEGIKECVFSAGCGIGIFRSGVIKKDGRTKDR
jgi:hypothetical protein